MTNATLQNRTMAFHSWLKFSKKVQFREAKIIILKRNFNRNIVSRNEEIFLRNADFSI